MILLGSYIFSGAAKASFDEFALSFRPQKSQNEMNSFGRIDWLL
jgi:hypothetical protein